MGEFMYQKMERDTAYRAEIHRAIGCCQDGRCKEKTVTVAVDDFQEGA